MGGVYLPSMQERTPDSQRPLSGVHSIMVEK
jgi:hypothetical protein